MKKLLPALLLLTLTPAWSQPRLYGDAQLAHLGPLASAEVGTLKRVGIREILVPTWLPPDLQNAQVTADIQDTRFGPGLKILWKSKLKASRSLVLIGASGGFGGPGPDKEIPLQNPTLGKLQLGFSDKAPLHRYGTDWLKISQGSGHKDYYVELYTNEDDKSQESLSQADMTKILQSLRYLKL